MQFVTWVGQLLSGNLGTSLISQTPVTKLIAPAPGADHQPGAPCHHPLGADRGAARRDRGVAAWRLAGQRRDGRSRCSGFSLPVFVIGYILIQIFAIELKWLPVQGFRSISGGIGPFLERVAPARA